MKSRQYEKGSATLTASQTVTERFNAALALSRQLTQERWDLAVGRANRKSDAARRLVAILCDPELSRGMKELLTSKEVSPGIDSLFPLGVLLSCRYSFDPSLGERPNTLGEVSPEGLETWLRTSDEALSSSLGIDTVTAILSARGLSEAKRVAKWLAEVGEVLSETYSASVNAPVASDEQDTKVLVSALGRIGLSAPLLDSLRIDHAIDDTSVARCYAFDLPNDVRVVVPRRTRIGAVRTLAHEIGHAVYFRTASGSGRFPWAFEPQAGPESVAFSFEYLAPQAVTGNSVSPQMNRTILDEVMSAVQAGRQELLLHMGEGQPYRHNAVALIKSPWQTLDYALGRVTGFLVLSAALRDSPLHIGQAVMDLVVSPGGTSTWATRHAALGHALGVDRRLIPPLKENLARQLGCPAPSFGTQNRSGCS